MNWVRHHLGIGCQAPSPICDASQQPNPYDAERSDMQGDADVLLLRQEEGPSLMPLSQ
jgi:hypothetical protein